MKLQTLQEMQEEMELIKKEWNKIYDYHPLIAAEYCRNAVERLSYLEMKIVDYFSNKRRTQKV